MKTRVFVCATALVAIAGCGSVGEGGGDDDPAVDAGGSLDRADAAVTNPSLADEIEGDVVGHYVIHTQTAAIMNLPIVGYALHALWAVEPDRRGRQRGRAPAPADGVGAVSRPWPDGDRLRPRATAAAR